jgi:hypothetical protein
MFICQVSGKQSEPGEKSFRLVTKTRQKSYTNKVKRIFKGVPKLVDKVTHGWEIVEELIVCKEVYDRLQGAALNVTNQSPVRSTYGNRPYSSEQRKDFVRQPQKHFGRQGQKANQVSGGQRTPKPVRAQQSNSNRGMSTVHKKPNSQT